MNYAENHSLQAKMLLKHYFKKMNPEYLWTAEDDRRIGEIVDQIIEAVKDWIVKTESHEE